MLKTEDVIAWQGELLSDLAPKTVRDLRHTLAQVVDQGISSVWRVGTSCARSRRPRCRQLPACVLSVAEVRTLMKAAHEDRYGAAIGLLFHQGWRVSEALGLAWEDLDLDRGARPGQTRLHLCERAGRPARSDEDRWSDRRAQPDAHCRRAAPQATGGPGEGTDGLRFDVADPSVRRPRDPSCFHHAVWRLGSAPVHRQVPEQCRRCRRVFPPSTWARTPADDPSSLRCTRRRASPSTRSLASSVTRRQRRRRATSAIWATVRRPSPSERLNFWIRPQTRVDR